MNAGGSSRLENNFILAGIFRLRIAGSIGTFGLLIVGFWQTNLYVGLLLPKEWRRF